MAREVSPVPLSPGNKGISMNAILLWRRLAAEFTGAALLLTVFAGSGGMGAKLGGELYAVALGQ